MKPTLTSDEYVQRGGHKCPKCMSTDIIGECIEVDDGSVTQEITCQNCGSSWTDQYTLTGYDDFLEGKDLD